MVNYGLKLEFNYKNVMVFTVSRHISCEIVALIMLEDRCRKGELMRDFAYLHGTCYQSEEDWDDERNLIVATIFPLCKHKKFQEYLDDLDYLAETLVEFKPAVNHKVEVRKSSKVDRLFTDKEAHWNEFINTLLSYCENKEAVNLDDEAFNHLNQNR